MLDVYRKADEDSLVEIDEGQKADANKDGQVTTIAAEKDADKVLEMLVENMHAISAIQAIVANDFA